MLVAYESEKGFDGGTPFLADLCEALVGDRDSLPLIEPLIELKKLVEVDESSISDVVFQCVEKLPSEGLLGDVKM